jgi:predicted Zn-dependent peptidase
VNKYEIKGFDIDLYHETLDNGLEVYIIPKNNSKNIYATLTTRFSSNDIEFIPIDSNKFVKVPLGIAHFLEHQAFEQENGKPIFELFSEYSANVNAATSKNYTNYYFNSIGNLKENLTLLLDFVQSPYFTDESVEKEKGIIIQELKMNENNPYRVAENIAAKNLFVNNNMKYPIIGTIESINKTTKKDLYKCYNTFYHPANMFLVVSGNIDPIETINIIKENQSSKKFAPFKKIIKKEIIEPDNVAKEKEVIEMDISNPIVNISYKVNISKIKGISINNLYRWCHLFLAANLSLTSELNEKLINEGILTNNIDYYIERAGNHFIIDISGETNKIDQFIQEIDKQLKKLETSENDFYRKKKCMISNNIMGSDSIFSLNNFVSFQVLYENKFDIDRIQYIKDMKYKTYMNLIKKLDLSNKTVTIVKPKNV